MSCLAIRIKSITTKKFDIQVTSVCEITEGYTVLFASDGKLLTATGETIYKKR